MSLTFDQFNLLKRIANRMESSYEKTDLQSFMLDNLPEVPATFRPFGATEGTEVAEMVACILRGEKIYAIKALRAATGGGLKECKDTVETIERVLTQALGFRPNMVGFYPVKPPANGFR